MRVLAVLNELRPSGAEVGLRAVGREWARYGIEMELLATAPGVGPYAGALTDAGYPVHHIPLEPFSRFVPAYVRLLRRGGYDLVHVHIERAAAHVALLARLARRKVACTSHNVRYSWRGLLRAERVVHRALVRAAGVPWIAVSTSVADSERRRFGNRTLLILNCYDDRRFRPPSPEQRAAARRELGVDDEYVVVSVANCAPQKNHAALIEALAMLVRSGGPSLTYLHAGLEEAGTPERALADRLAVRDRTRFMGGVDDVLPLLHAADCYVMPSRYEGLPLAALEALGVGVPSVLADVPGLRDLADLVPGIEWTTPDAESIAAGLRAVAAGGEAGRVRARSMTAPATRSHFSVDSYVRQHAALYHRLCRTAMEAGAPAVRSADGARRPSGRHEQAVRCDR